jgi:hypothetical protein
MPWGRFTLSRRRRRPSRDSGAALDLDPWGASALKLVEGLPPGLPGLEATQLLPLAAALDKLYIPTRYPDALPGITPAAAYTGDEARIAIQQAREVLERVRVAIGD